MKLESHGLTGSCPKGMKRRPPQNARNILIVLPKDCRAHAAWLCHC
ncbi:hypothetical protein ACFPB0_07760 [Glycocaulis abyssi]|uniref:Uncharacterized protein n=1 Tax=Glycocaulis abyssi TaxID=1433403 RepID=A0ABV9N9Z4_9PROT